MSDVDALRALMEADRWIERVDAQRSHLPEKVELATLETQLRELLGELRAAEAHRAVVQASFDDVEHETERLRARVRDIDRNMNSSTVHARDLSAMQSESIHVRALVSEREDRELELLESLDEHAAIVAAVRARAQPGVARRTELADAIAQLGASLNEELVTLRAQRVELRSAVADGLAGRYDAAMARVGTSGASRVVEGRCDGCRIALSPLDFDRWRALAVDVVMDCPECGRLLVP